MLETCSFNKKETLEQMFSCEFCEFYKTYLVAASEFHKAIFSYFRLNNELKLNNFLFGKTSEENTSEETITHCS